MERLENDITLLGRAITFPQTPPLAARVRSQIAREGATRAPAPSWQLALTALAAVAVTLAFIVGVLPPARNAVADIFDRINIFEVEEVPTDVTRDITGADATLEEAQAAVGFRLALPDDQQPDRVLVQDFGQVKAAVLFYRHEGRIPYAFFQTSSPVGKGISTGKGVTDPAQAQPVTGLGGEAYWLTGLRITQYQEVDGAVVQQSLRATDVNTLLWNEGSLIFRIEGDLTQKEAIEIANSLR